MKSFDQLKTQMDEASLQKAESNRSGLSVDH